MTAKKVWRPFEEARGFVRSLQLRNQTEWNEYCKSNKKPDDIPSYPDKIYKNDSWKGMIDWLGNEDRIRKPISEETKRKLSEANKGNWRPFEEARGFVRSLQLRSVREWEQYSKSGKDGIPRPNDIPSHPAEAYKNDGWKGMIDWLGNEDRIPELVSEETKRKISETKKKSWKPFDEARGFVRSLQLKNTREWEEYRNSGKKPDDIPSHPNVIYKNDWVSWPDWLGYEELA